MPSTMQRSSSSSSARSTPASCSSTPSQPIQIGFNPSANARADSFYNSSSYSSNTSNFSTTSVSSTSAAGPSPYGSSCFGKKCLQRSAPSSYFSDAELFGGEQAPFLDEPPAPPRGAEAWLTLARAEGHSPPRMSQRPFPVPFQRSDSKREARLSPLSARPGREH